MPRSDSPLIVSSSDSRAGEDDDIIDNFPFFNHTAPIPTQQQQQQQQQQQPVLRRNPTLAELLRRVDDVQSPPFYHDHHQNDVVVELGRLQTNSSRTMITRVPFVLSFTDLFYSVKVRRNWFSSRRNNASGTERNKVLLNKVSGMAREGEIMAVLGASGSGKSTLIDALAHRISADSLRGSVALNGNHLDSRLSKAISAYVMQDDLLFPMLTVEETLMFAAEFRLPRSLSKTAKRARVHALLDQLGLRASASTVIGDEGHRGVSGGERRRVSIGADIIHDPILLLLDEPTSGLDSTSAYMVIKVLKRIAVSGSIVIMSIHQPSYRILGLLDRLHFLSHGNTVYAGPPTGLSGFFSEFGHPIPDNNQINRTEFALDLIRELEQTGPRGTDAIVEFNKTWQGKTSKMINSADYVSDGGMSVKEAIRARISTTNKTWSSSSAFANPWWVEMAVIAKRTVTNSRRMPEEFGVRLGAVIVTGGILATVFWRLDHSPKGVEERIGLFAFAMSTTFYTCAEAIPVFLQERYIFMRETAYNAYRRSSYVLAHSLTTLPSLLFLSLTFAAATFWATGLAGGFHFYFLAILASFWAGSSFVTFLSGVVTNVMLGYTVVVAVLAYFLLFSGFFITSDRIPTYWLWFHYLSLVKYPYQAVLRNEFERSGPCFATGLQIFDNTPLAAVPDVLKSRMLESMSRTLGTNITASTCVTTGIDILRQQGVTGLSMWACLWITVAWGFFFRILFYFTLLLGSKNKRS